AHLAGGRGVTAGTTFIVINGRRVGRGHRPYVVAELSANHNQDFEQAAALVREAKARGADAVKLQTYTADTITLDSAAQWFRLPTDNTWGGRTLHELYRAAFTPWDWQPKLKALAGELGIDLFSTPFDTTAVDFLEEMRVPAST